MTHDPLCRLLKKESCSGIGGSDWGHYTDQEYCRNCNARCDCDRVREIRAAVLAWDDYSFDHSAFGVYLLGYYPKEES